jgi:hypothetical protein
VHFVGLFLYRKICLIDVYLSVVDIVCLFVCLFVCSLLIYSNSVIIGARDNVVVKAPCYKPAGRGFDSRWCYCNFSVT